LPRQNNHCTNVVLFADDNSIKITEKNYENLNQNIRLTSDFTRRWFRANQLVLNLVKTNITKFSSSHFLHSQLITKRNSTIISEGPETKFGGAN
jgi:hypothetical protein